MAKPSVDHGRQAFRILQIAFVITPILAGFDKFFRVLFNWSSYVSPFVVEALNTRDSAILMGLGCVEIIAGIGVFFKPRIFSYVVALWFLGIIVTLLIIGNHLDIALRDAALMLSAFALARLSPAYSKT